MISRHIWVYCLVILLSLGGGLTPAYGQKISLQTGDVLNGKLVAFQPERVDFMSERFGLMSIEFGAVQQIEHEDGMSINLKNGERIVATLLQPTRLGIIAKSSFGQVQIVWKDIIAITTSSGRSSGSQSVDQSAGRSQQSVLQHPPAAETPDAPQKVEPRNEISVGLSVMGNQTSNLFGPPSRKYVSTNQLSYMRSFERGYSVGVRLPGTFEISPRNDGTGRSVSRGGLGDLSIHGTKRLELGEGGPSISFTALGRFPTGRSGGPENTTLNGLSSGNWAAGFEVVGFIPVSSGGFVAGIGYTQSWPSNAQSAGYQTSREINWAAGYNINLNQNWQLLTTATGVIEKNTAFRREPAYVNLQPSYITESGYRIQFSLAHGLNSDAADYFVGVSVSKKW